ncbi:MAG: sel1 repeat family protein [Proteobacteria bacterium]|nr:sel1 repeat family protein [Pseudomonadota bacterium]
MRTLCLFAALLVAGPAFAGAPEGIAAAERGDYETAFREFQALAEAGDSKAMVTIGIWFHRGQGFPVDYDKAMSWYLRALDLGDGDALNNLGVMYRDGLGVERNRQVAYLAFLIVHMQGMGSEATVRRANRNLRREADELSQAQIAEALCWTPEYLLAFIRGRGAPPPPASLARSETRRAFRDLDWWLESEREHLPRCGE